MATSQAADIGSSDPHKWLEKVLDEQALAWVESKNAEAIAALGDPTETETFKRILAILDSKDKIPSAFRIGGVAGTHLYNFWQDEKHPQGIWRKCTLESFRSSDPEWSIVIDVDALPPPTTDTAKTWVWHGSTLLDEGPLTGHKTERALISLSPGGSDADTFREFDLIKESWVEPTEGGFAVATPAKTRKSWRSRDELLIGTDFNGDGSTLTNSGYPRVVKSWKRGTPLEDAKLVFEGEQADVSASQYGYEDRGFAHEFQVRTITFYTSKRKYRKLTVQGLESTTAADEAAPFLDVPIQEDAKLSTFANSALITLRSEWSPPGAPGGATYAPGTLLAVPMDDVMKNDWSNIVPIFEPTATKSLSKTVETKDYLILKVLDDVRTKLAFWKFESGSWVLQGGQDDAGEAVAAGEDVDVRSIDRSSDADNKVWITRDGYIVPDTLEMASAADGCTTTEKFKAKPAMFDSSGLVVEQHFATSLDGTKIPYCVMRKKDLPFDGSSPTLLGAYGGFEISRLPAYSATVGAGWLEKGGVKVIANIRGGGEYGPKWHQAALREKRHKCYEDVEAVAKDIIERKITSQPKLACIGGSNGGLMVGNLLCRPVASSLFGAAVCQVPLLDMKVYSHLLAGASWMAEYGNPDKPEEWNYLRRHSPYQMLRHDCLGKSEADADKLPEIKSVANEVGAADAWICPKVLFTTSTRDDRVHPGHARKMVAALSEEAPKEKVPLVLYWENTEGGHGGAADNKQRAFMWALTYRFLAVQLALAN